MKVEIDEGSGFCFGVVNAITLAEKSLAGGGPVYCLGDIVHNRVEMERLEGLGLVTARHDQLEGLPGATVLIRAHGEPPSTYETAKKNALHIIDATCPVVAALQKTVAAAHERMTREGGQVVILGKKGHAEVVGLTGQVNGGAPVIVVEGMDDLSAVDTGKPVYLLSQTTQSLSLFARVSEALRSRAADHAAVVVHDTVCRRVANREPHLRAFASHHDVIVFVAGRKSSNGRLLFEVCRSANPRSYMVEDQTELRPEWFEGAATAGVCGATSTPRWLMERVSENIETICR